MTKDMFKKFTDITQDKQEKDLLYSMIMFHAAPVFTGKKPSALITFAKNNRSSYRLWQKYRREFSENNSVEYFELRKTDKYILVLFYSRQILQEVIINKRNMNFLKKFGYNSSMSLEKSLKLLKSRFEEVCPHEMGIFLGYPVKDVVSFIECSGKNCLMCGYWKVYHNPVKATKTFEAYDRAKENILNLIIKEKNLYKLISAY